MMMMTTTTMMMTMAIRYPTLAYDVKEGHRMISIGLFSVSLTDGYNDDDGDDFDDYDDADKISNPSL